MKYRESSQKWPERSDFVFFIFILVKIIKQFPRFEAFREKKSHSFEHSCEASGKLFGALEDSH